MSKDPGGLTIPLASLKALQKLLSEFDDRGVIIGGVAASLLGTPRFSVDIDAVFLLGVDDIPRILHKAASLGIEPRINNVDVFAKRTRVLLLQHIPSKTNIDLSLGILPFEVEMVERAQLVDTGQIILRIPTAEDLIILKAVAHRPKDLEDIRAVASNHPALDKGRIEYWVRQFGDALDLPHLWEMIEKLL